MYILASAGTVNAVTTEMERSVSFGPWVLLLPFAVLVIVWLMSLTKTKKRSKEDVSQELKEFRMKYKELKIFYDLCLEELIKSKRLREKILENKIEWSDIEETVEIQERILGQETLYKELQIKADFLLNNQTDIESTVDAMKELNERVSELTDGLKNDLEILRAQNIAASYEINSKK